MTFWRWILGIYAALCFVAIAVMLIGMFGWFGQEADPIASVYAIVLAMPWALAMNGMAPFSPAVLIAGLVAAMILNLILLMAVGRLFSKLFRRPPVHGNHTAQE